MRPADVRLGPVVNRAIYPQARTGGGGWVPQWGTGGAGTQGYTTGWGGFEGRYFTRVEWTTGATGGSPRIYATSGSVIPVTPGEAIDLSAMVACDRPSVSLTVDFRLAGAYKASALGEYFPTSWPTPALIPMTVIVPEGVDGMSIFVNPRRESGGMPSGTRLLTGELMVGDGPYTDGDSPNAAWLGPVNASPSVGYPPLT